MLWCGVPQWHKLRIVITEHLFDLISMEQLFVILSEICLFSCLDAPFHTKMPYVIIDSSHLFLFPLR